MTHRYKIPLQTAETYANCIAQAISDTDVSELGLVARMGSTSQRKEFVGDVDVLAIPKTGAKLGKAFVQLSRLLSNAQDRFSSQTNGGFITTYSHHATQDEATYISQLQNPGRLLVPVHMIFFTDHADVVKKAPLNFVENYQRDAIPLIGSLDAILPENKVARQVKEPMFQMVYCTPGITSSYPLHVALSKAEHFLSYVRKNYGIEVELPSEKCTAAECKRIIENSFLEIDKAA